MWLAKRYWFKVESMSGSRRNNCTSNFDEDGDLIASFLFLCFPFSFFFLLTGSDLDVRLPTYPYGIRPP